MRDGEGRTAPCRCSRALFPRGAGERVRCIAPIRAFAIRRNGNGKPQATALQPATATSQTRAPPPSLVHFHPSPVDETPRGRRGRPPRRWRRGRRARPPPRPLPNPPAQTTVVNQENKIPNGSNQSPTPPTRIRQPEQINMGEWTNLSNPSKSVSVATETESSRARSEKGGNEMEGERRGEMK